MLTYIIQDVAEGAEEVTEEKLVLFDLLFRSGTGGAIIISILAILLFAAMYIYFERLFAVRAASKTDKNFMAQIRDAVTNGNIESAKIRCAQENSPVARLTAKGISRIGSPLEDINTAIENAGRLEVYKLEKKRSYFGNYCRSCSNDWFLRNRYWYGFGLS